MRPVRSAARCASCVVPANLLDVLPTSQGSPAVLPDLATQIPGRSTQTTRTLERTRWFSLRPGCPPRRAECRPWRVAKWPDREPEDGVRHPPPCNGHEPAETSKWSPAGPIAAKLQRGA